MTKSSFGCVRVHMLLSGGQMAKNIRKYRTLMGFRLTELFDRFLNDLQDHFLLVQLQILTFSSQLNIQPRGHLVTLSSRPRRMSS